MWHLDPRPFEIVRCTSANHAPLSYWSDYVYGMEHEDPGLDNLTELDPARIVVNYGAKLHVVPMGGRALRLMWQRRQDIPEKVWKDSFVKELGFSQVSFDGLRLSNPHGVLCSFYLRRREKQVFWGLAPMRYPWGAPVPTIAYLLPVLA